MTVNSSLKLVILDCDGTLADSQGEIISVMNAAFKDHKLAKPDPQAVRKSVGLELEEAISSLLPGGNESLWNDVSETYRTHAYARRDAGKRSEPLFDGAKLAIETMSSRGWVLGIATMKSMRGLTHLLGEHDIGRHFSTLQTGDGNPGKPNPEMLFRALSETGATATSAVMVGDTSYDMQMAVNAGFNAVGVAWGYHEVQELRDAGAVAIADDFETLPEVLEKLFGIV